LRDQHFDKWQFANRRPHPVSATSDGHGSFSTPGVSFEDFSRMSTMQRKTTGERRLPTPSWAVNDKELQHLLVVFMEVRACFRKHKDFPLNENKKDRTPEALKSRLQKATEEVLARRAGQLAAMKRLNEEYHHIRHQGFISDVEQIRLRQLEIEIESLNTYLRYSQNGGADVVAGMVYLYYRAGMDSVGVASELGIKPQHVRQTIWRLHRTADLIAGVKRVVPTKEERAARKLARAEKLRLEKEDRTARAVERAELARKREAEREGRRIVWAAECVRRAAEREAMSITRDAEKFRREAERLQRASVRALRVPKASRERNCTCGNPLPCRATKYCVACKPKTHHRFQDRTCACGNPLPPWVRTCADCKKEKQPVRVPKVRSVRTRRYNLSRSCMFCGGPLPYRAHKVCGSEACQKAYAKFRSNRPRKAVRPHAPKVTKPEVISAPAPVMLKGKMPRWMLPVLEAV
jgi:hypothetical protein